jgi:hypothetical protein
MGTSNYEGCKATEERVGKAQAAAFDATFRKEIDSLKNVGYEFQNGMIVRSLTRDEKISVGQVAYDELSDAEKKNSGSCYVNPTSCGKLLHQDFEIKYNDNGVTGANKE